MKRLIAILFLSSAVLRLQSQGFLNLNFEQANLTGYPPGSSDVPITNALPHWTGYFGSPTFGTNQSTQALYDAVLLGSGGISIQDTNGNIGIPLPLAGRYSVVLEGSRYAGQYSAIIGQTGQIPDSAKSLTLWGFIGANNVTFNGQNLPLVLFDSTPNYNIYGADVSTYVGQTGELRFTANYLEVAILDNIQFSTAPVPEPGALALGGLGLCLFGFRRWKK